MDHQAMVMGIKQGPSAMMDLEMEAVGRDRPAQILERRARKAVSRRQVGVRPNQGSLNITLFRRRHAVTAHGLTGLRHPFGQSNIGAGLPRHCKSGCRCASAQCQAAAQQLSPVHKATPGDAVDR
jgi:hypothetical protein